MSLADVTVRNTGSLGGALVQVDLGAISGELTLDVVYQTDRYRKVRLTWSDPRIADADNATVWLGNAVLDTATGELLPPDFDCLSNAARRRPRTRA